MSSKRVQTPLSNPDAAPSQPSEPEYRPSDLTDGSEDEFEADLADEDGMKSKPGSNMDVDSDVEVEEEEDVFPWLQSCSTMRCSSNGYFHGQNNEVMILMKRNGFHLEFAAIDSDANRKEKLGENTKRP
ncbi:hypothetical protein B0H14DRAFT_3887717 [Mycena olivaceomarginata]|nr:hypothetical protein B0H14DRAFT_3887717 [Mycena olivaceomarginata]